MSVVHVRIVQPVVQPPDPARDAPVVPDAIVLIDVIVVVYVSRSRRRNPPRPPRRRRRRRG